MGYGIVKELSLCSMRLDPFYISLCLAPALTSLVVAMCITTAISNHFWRMKHMVPDDGNREIVRAALRKRKHFLIGAIWCATLLGIAIMACYLHP